MNDLEEIFTKLAWIIEGAEHSDDGDFEVSLPEKEWHMAELSLGRKAAIRKWQDDHFIWRGVVVARGDDWGVHGV